MRVWIKVTRDELRLPIAMADTARELAEIVGTTADNIYRCVCAAKRRGGQTVYECVEIEEE